MKLSFYGVIRIFTGILLVIQGYSEGIAWEACFMKISNHSFIRNTFSLSTVKYAAFLVPFFKFILGSMITLGIFTKNVLFINYLFFLLLALLFLFLGNRNYALYQIVIATITYILYIKIDYNRYAMDEKLSL